jgi:hypothetical protein
VAKADLQPFLDLPLFRFTDPNNIQADSLVRGVVEGQETMVMHLRSALVYPTLIGLRSYRGPVQTLAFFPDVEAMPDFHLAAQEHPWNAIAPDWPEELHLGPVVRVFNGYSLNPILIRGQDAQEVARLFPPDCERELGDLTGWTIECQSGNLLIYRSGEKMSMEDLPYFVNRTLELVSVLTRRDWLAQARAPGANVHVQTSLPRRGKDGYFRQQPPSRAADR